MSRHNQCDHNVMPRWLSLWVALIRANRIISHSRVSWFVTLRQRDNTDGDGDDDE